VSPTTPTPRPSPLPRPPPPPPPPPTTSPLPLTLPPPPLPTATTKELTECDVFISYVFKNVNIHALFSLKPICVFIVWRLSSGKPRPSPHPRMRMALVNCGRNLWPCVGRWNRFFMGPEGPARLTQCTMALGHLWRRNFHSVKARMLTLPRKHVIKGCKRLHQIGQGIAISGLSGGKRTRSAE